MHAYLVLGLLAGAAPLAARDIYLEPRPEDVPALVTALKDPNLRTGAALALAKVGKPAVPALQRALGEEDATLRLWSAFALGGIGPQARDAVEALARLAQDSDHELRAIAIEALGKIGPAAAAAVPTLIGALKDKQPRVRCRSAAALGEIRADSPEAVRALIGSLKDEPARNAACQSLVQIGRPALPGLLDALADDDVRPEVALALRRIDPETAARAGVDKATPRDIPALVRLLQNTERAPGARRRAGEELGQLGPEAVPAVPALVDVLADAAVRDCATLALAKIGKPALPALVVALKGPDARAREATACALGKIGSDARAALPALAVALRDSDRDVRRAAAVALEFIGPDAKEAVPALIKALLSDSSEPVRLAAIKALVRAPAEAKESVVAALVAATKEPNYGVKMLAESALKRVDAAAAAKAGGR